MARTDKSLARRLKDGVPDGVAQSIRNGTVRWGAMTARARMQPDFLVVGAQRAGTTTLYRMLVEHPSIVRPSFQKGIGYFDLNYGRGADWYQGHFPVRSFAEWRTRKSGEPMTFESSGYYLFHPLGCRADHQPARDQGDRLGSGSRRTSLFCSCSRIRQGLRNTRVRGGDGPRRGEDER